MPFYLAIIIWFILQESTLISKSIVHTKEFCWWLARTANREQSWFRIMYTTNFQARATFISHGNTAWAKHFEETKLATICRTVAADKSNMRVHTSKLCRSYLSWILMVHEMLAFDDMMRKKITMQAVHSWYMMEIMTISLMVSH